MLYLVSLFIPPLGVLFAGRPFVALLLAAAWVASLLLTFGLSHIVFVVLAWVIIASAKGDKRHRELIKTRG